MYRGVRIERAEEYSDALMELSSTLPPQTAKLDILCRLTVMIAEVVADGILQTLSRMRTEIPHQVGEQETC